MNIKEKVFNNIIKRLENDKNTLNNKIRSNLYTLRKLVEEQTILKRERVKLTEIINSLKYKGE